ncbi:MAG: hypothetical protein BWK80_25390 [Desulfobacteraceae bacterium IS3]|nr:MAG: hypothetical protein BWK80_25390 [Desulfobacteraceae bacterium IS3]
MEVIAQNSFYTIKVDKKKNRVYNIFSGYWQKESDVPNYLNDGHKAMKHVSKGFTCLTDTVKMKIPSEAISKLHVKMQKIYMDAGLRKTAEILPSALVKLAVKRLSDQSGMLAKAFDSWEEAEKWLDN